MFLKNVLNLKRPLDTGDACSTTKIRNNWVCALTWKGGLHWQENKLCYGKSLHKMKIILSVTHTKSLTFSFLYWYILQHVPKTQFYLKLAVTQLQQKNYYKFELYIINDLFTMSKQVIFMVSGQIMKCPHINFHCIWPDYEASFPGYLLSCP